MQGIGDRLYARGLMLHQGNRTVAVVVCDMLTTPASLYREVRKILPPRTSLFLAATHTHSAPDSQMLNDRMTFQIPGIASYRPRWLPWYAERISSAAQTLGPWRTPGSYHYLISHADANRERRKFGDPDQTFTRLCADSTTLLAEYAAHGTFYTEAENLTRGDWPGVLSARLSAPVLVGAIGDVSPKAEGANPAERCSNLSERLLSATPESIDEGQVPILSFVQTKIELDRKMPHPTFAKAYGITPGLASILVEKFAPSEAEISAFRVGSLAVVGVPGEPTSHLGRQIRDYGRTLGFGSVLVISHVNGWMGYILGPEDYDRGGYEATLSFYGREEGNKVVESACAALRSLASNQVK